MQEEDVAQETHPWQKRRPETLPRRLSLRVIRGPDQGKRLDLVADPAEREAYSIGSAEGNALRLSDTTVSRYHLEVELREAGLWVHDLGSSNGTYCGELRIREAFVPLGSTLALGTTVLRIEDQGQGKTQRRQDLQDPVPEIIGRSTAILTLKQAIARLAPTLVSVLIQGETGTGKELVARALHRHSERAKSEFVVVDCGSLPATLIASELFGHEKGAFTGAERRHIGAFERAHRGTLFLDEIGELPLALQPTLLGALERRRFRRVGGQQELEVDVRVVAATNRDLRAEANTGAFRPDLYHRLGAARIVVPPLRDRPEDIELLVAFFSREMTGQNGLGLMSESTMQALRSQRWSGNVRELRNVIEYAFAVGELGLQEKPEPVTPAAAKDSDSLSPPSAATLLPYREARASALEAFERAYLQELVQACGGNASEAARRARMDRSYLLSLLRRHALR